VPLNSLLRIGLSGKLYVMFILLHTPKRGTIKQAKEVPLLKRKKNVSHAT
jgi:hypothetical protein